MSPYLPPSGLLDAESFVAEFLARHPGFVRDCARGFVEGLLGLGDQCAADPAGASADVWRALVGRELLLATDLADPDRDSSAPARFLGLFDPYARACNLVARFDAGDEVRA
jgi:hypothetical protein